MKHPRLFAIVSILLSLSLIFLVPILKTLKPFLPHTNYLLGKDKPTSYLILLGNDTEIRANGGFVGSYAKLIANFPNYELTFQDIYVPNGQLEGYVTPPPPIQEAFLHGTWQLANADWEPDFPTAANTIRWFMEKGKEINPDNLIILNLSTINKVLDVVGSFIVPEFKAEITPGNLYLFLQGKAELNFFPGSTQKKDALTAVGKAFSKKLLSLSLDKKIKIADILYQDLKNQNILINSTNEEFQNLLFKNNFTGNLSSNSADTYLLIEANLGANKANAYVTRETTHTISFQNDQALHKVELKLTNTSPESGPNPPYQYGGDYKVYLRFYIPPNTQNISLTGGNKKITPTIASKFNLTEVGFWQTVPAQNQSAITLSYTLPTTFPKYTLSILKQHGLVTSPQTININGKNLKTNLEKDFFLP